MQLNRRRAGNGGRQTTWWDRMEVLTDAWAGDRHAYPSTRQLARSRQIEHKTGRQSREHHQEPSGQLNHHRSIGRSLMSEGLNFETIQHNYSEKEIAHTPARKSVSTREVWWSSSRSYLALTSSWESNPAWKKTAWSQRPCSIPSLGTI